MLTSSLRPVARPDKLDVARYVKTGPETGDAASLATKQSILNPSALIVLGIFGTDDDRKALVRTPDGRTGTHRAGDRIEGRAIVAVDDDSLLVRVNGRAHRLQLPS